MKSSFGEHVRSCCARIGEKTQIGKWHELCIKFMASPIALWETLRILLKDKMLKDLLALKKRELLSWDTELQ
jgi:hypothetical protein